MVEDKTNRIYTQLMECMENLYPNIKGGTVYKDSSPSFPYIYMFQIDGETKLTTLSNTEDGINLAYQIEIYSNSGMNMARKIANDVRTFMIENGFRCRLFRPSQSPSNVSRFLTRFNRLDV